MRLVLIAALVVLRSTPADVYIDYELEFVPDGRAAAAGMQELRTVWMDVMGLMPYPVFDVHRGAGGRDGRYTYPRESGRTGYTRDRCQRRLSPDGRGTSVVSRCADRHELRH